MKKKNKMLLFVCYLVCTGVFAQQKKSEPANLFRYKAITQLAYMAGNTSGGAAFQLINGVTYNKWYAGAGVALDYYRYRSFPVFADVRYHFSEKRNSIFVYADGGVHIPWQNKEQVNGIDSKLSGGLYTDAGFGYKINQKNGNALVISFGYSHKKVKEERKEFLWLPAIRDVNIPEQKVRYEYGLNRIAIKFGLFF
jgi:hypothetical protein